LREAYDRVVARLEEHRALLAEVVDVLVEKQELGGAELQNLIKDEVGTLKSRALQPLGESVGS
jgi:ATP-dependent Zn protease